MRFPADCGGRTPSSRSWWRPSSYQELRELQSGFALNFLDAIEHLPPDLYRKAAIFLVKKLDSILWFGLFENARLTLRAAMADDEIRRNLRLKLSGMVEFRRKIPPQPPQTEEDAKYIYNYWSDWADELARSRIWRSVSENSRAAVL